MEKEQLQFLEKMGIIPFGDARCCSPEKVGPKVANLSKMLSVGIPVPPGYGVDFSNYDHFLTNGNLPVGLVNAISHIRDELGGKIAIRSSASCEDGGENSMAGVFETFYVSETDDIGDVITSIYTQSRSQAVLEYLQLKGISEKDLKMGLGVQKLIDPELAGVIYAGVGKDSNKILIQYVKGFGKNLVDGKDMGNLILLDPDGNKIHESDGFSFNKSSLKELATLCQNIKSEFKDKPQDIEFAYKEGKFYILQSRPLTTALEIDSFENKFNEGKSRAIVLALGPKIEGVVLNIDEFTLEEAKDVLSKLTLEGNKVILVAKETDLRHDPLIDKSLGLVVATAGITSHSAQRAREAKIGALTNVPVNELHTFDKVIFNTKEAYIAKIVDGQEIIVGPSSELTWQLQNEILLGEHLSESQKYVFEKDLGIEAALEWFKNSLKDTLPENYASTLYNIVVKNKPTAEVEYVETGYDSCQSHRKVSKVAAEAILLGGLAYEANLLGKEIDLEQAISITSSKLKLNESEFYQLAKIAKDFGESQDFIFPGVTPTPGENLSLEILAKKALKGNPLVSVRTITGVGGLRQDKEWNHATDFSTFLELKILEDKRYYPGLGIVHLLINAKNPENLPVMQKLSEGNPGLYKAVVKMVNVAKNTHKRDYEGLSILCSAYLPEKKEFKGKTIRNDVDMELAGAFHTPSYELGALRQMFEEIGSGNFSGHEETVERVIKATKRIWSFNSTIHLPWGDKKATLANGLIGKIRNEDGSYAVRYGVGYKGKSVEIIEYHHSNRGRSYTYKKYNQSELFSGPHEDYDDIYDADERFPHKINLIGFIDFALASIEGR